MHAFHDKEGTEWVIDLTLGRAMAIENYDFSPALHLNTDTPYTINFIDPDEKFFTDTITNTAICFGMIWCCCREQAEKRNITNEAQFAERFNGDTLVKAKMAFYEELPLFFSDRATSLQSLIGKYQVAQKMVSQKLQQRIDQILPPEKLEQIVDRELDKMQQEVTTALES